MVAVKETAPDRLNLIPTGKCVLKENDIMILMGPDSSLQELKEKE